MGERDIHKVPLEIPIPRFDSTDPIHGAIGSLACDASELVSAAAKFGAFEGSLAKRRAAAREVAALPLAKLHKLVKKLLEG